MRQYTSVSVLRGILVVEFVLGGTAIQINDDPLPHRRVRRHDPRDKLPLVWLHIPKTGSSFMNTLLHTPSLCPRMPQDFAIDSSHCPPEAVMGCPYINKIYIQDVCKGSFWWDRKLGEHRALGPDFKGNAIGFFRQPESRMLSHFHYLMATQRHTAASQVKEFASKYQGCAVKMMAREGSEMGIHCGGGTPSAAEMHLALSRLNLFTYIGLTEEWDLSVCLFRKMFGGRCVGSDFINTRPGSSSNTSRPSSASNISHLISTNSSDESNGHLNSWPLRELHGFVDKYDGRLYSRATNKFERFLEEYNVSEDSCKPCFDEKDHAYVATDLRFVY